MRGQLKTFIFLLLSISVNAQTTLESLVSAEKAFAKMATDATTKKAFVQYLSDSSIIFRPGPVPGKAFWQGATDDNDLLTWEPRFADISAAGDMGYTTGPFEFRLDRKDEKPAGTGHFVSVWKKEKDSTWKVVLDIGIGHAPVPKKPFATSVIPAKRAPLTTADAMALSAATGETSRAETISQLLETDLRFSDKQTNGSESAYLDYLSKEARIYRPSAAPYENPEAIGELLKATDKQFTFTPVRADVAASGDLGYVYGGGTVAITEGEKVRNLDLNYVRIWKKEDGRDWKIVLDLISQK